MKKSKGFTLIEVIVGIVIIAIITIAAFEFFRYCRRFIVDVELRLNATNFAREVMEELDWDTEIANTTGWQSDRDLPAGGEFGSRLHDEYGGARLYIVEDGVGSYKKIRVKVTWEY